jgi:two-component system sensor histidine kinase PilS (NtrC family)
MEQQHLQKQILWLITLRVVIISTLLAAAMLIQFIRGEFFIELAPLYYLVGAVYFVTIVYLAVFTYVRRAYAQFVYAQLTGDLVTITALILFSGGILSPFHVLYILSIITASTILYRRGGLIIASGSFILYGLLVNLEFHNIVKLPGGILGEHETVSTYDVYYNLFVAFVGFYSAAFLSSYITERLRQANKSLKETSGNLEELLLFHENIINSMTTGLVTTDMNGLITSFNRAAEEISGRSFSAVRERNIQELFGSAGRMRQRYRSFSDKAGTESSFEIEFPRDNDSRRHLGVMVSNFFDRQDRLLGNIYMFQDLTEVKNLEREVRIKERMAAVGEMAAGIAHEIRNPLASMSGCIQMLRSGVSTGSRDAALMDIFLRESDRLNRIIEDFLFYARPSPTLPVWISLASLLRETFTLLQHSRELHEMHRVELLVDGEDEFRYRADPNQMKQVFWNLARNALQAMPDGGRLQISLRKNSDGGFSLIFEDDGIGMELEEIHKLFQPFHGKSDGGTGLGLAIVYRIIREHGGEVSVASQPGHGTRLTVNLPPVPGE